MTPIVRRAIVGFHRDDVGDWVAELGCGHGQHVRHKPPFQIRPWVQTGEGRDGMLGTELDCVRCDRFELPDGFVPYRRTSELDESTVPDGMLAQHKLRAGVWGMIHVLSGRLRYVVEPPLATDVILDPDHAAVVVPEVPHRVEPDGPVRFFVEFLRKAPPS